MGAYGLDLGTFSPFLYAFREREKILDLFEEACGARLTYSYLTRRRRDGRPAAAAGCRSARRSSISSSRSSHEYHTLLTTNAIFVQRTAGIGVLSPEMAIELRLHRPGAARQRRRSRPAPRRRRALHRNVRRLRLRSDRASRTATTRRTTPIRRCRTRPCSAIVGTGSTCGCSKWCKSIDLVRQAIDRYSTADRQPTASRSSSPRSCPRAKRYLETEAPARPDGLLSSSATATSIPWRARARSSCFCNLVGHATRSAAAA